MSPEQSAVLRELCLRVDAEQKVFLDVEAQIEQLRKHQEQLQGLREQAQGKVAYAIGGRDAVARAFLPEGMTLSDAWDADYKGLRSGKTGPKVVESGEDVGEEKKA